MAQEARPLAKHLHQSLKQSTWPRAAAVVDWGIRTRDPIVALQAAVDKGASALDLDNVCGDGPGIAQMLERFNVKPTGELESLTDWGTFWDYAQTEEYAERHWN